MFHPCYQVCGFGLPYRFFVYLNILCCTSSFPTFHHLAAKKFFALLVNSTSTPIPLFHSDTGIFFSITSITAGICFVTCINFTIKAEGCIIRKQNLTGVLIHVSCLHRTTSIQTHGWKTFWLSPDSSFQYCSACWMLQNNLEKCWKVTWSPSCKEVFYVLRIELNI